MDKWLPVQISDGLFPAERVAKLETADGTISFFVSTTQVKVIETGSQNSGEIRVSVLDEDSQYWLVQLPSQSGSKVAKVRKTA